MDYGYDSPLPKPAKRRRRRLGFSLGTNVMILVGTFVICAVIVKLADRPMQLNLKAPKPAAGTVSAAPHHR
jgi:hypothetical protein